MNPLFKKYLIPLLFAVLVLAGLSAAPATTVTILTVASLSVAALHVVASQKRSYRRSKLAGAVNTLPANVGTSVNSRRYRATAAVATRNLLAKKGADDEHIAAVAAASDEPIGVITDEAAAAEDPLDVELLGLTNRTLVLVAKAAIGVGADVYSDGTGKVTVKPTAAGTYWRVGVALTAPGEDNDPVEVLTIKPRKLIVLAALTNATGDIADTPSTAVNPTKADFDSLLVAAGKLQADFLLLAAALNSNADVAYATT